MENYLGVAKNEGISKKEIDAVKSIVMAVSAGRINAQHREIDIRLRLSKKVKDK